MDRDIMDKIYQDERMLDYLRYHPKWYYYLDLDRNNFNQFIKEFKKEYKETTYDRLEKLKTQVNFASSIMEYLKK